MKNLTIKNHNGIVNNFLKNDNNYNGEYKNELNNFALITLSFNEENQPKSIMLKSIKGPSQPSNLNTFSYAYSPSNDQTQEKELNPYVIIGNDENK